MVLMTFPFDVLDWLFGIGGQASASIGDWFKRIGADIASGLEAGFVALLKDIFDVIRPFLYVAIGVIIMALATLWLVSGNANISALLSVIAMAK